MDLQTLIRKLEVNESTISTFLGGLVMIVVAVLLLNYFGLKTSDDMSSTSGDVNLEETGLDTTLNQGEISATRVERYVVKKGDHLWKIAEDVYADGHRWKEIAQANGITDPDMIVEGQELDIPQVAATNTVDPDIKAVEEDGQVVEREVKFDVPSNYMVQRGDSLWKVAVEFYGDGYKWVDVWSANRDQVRNPDLIFPGQLLTLPN